MARGSRRDGLRALWLVTAVLGMSVIAPAAAQAGAGVFATPDFPGTMTVGGQNLPATIILRNANAAPDDALTLCNFGDTGACEGTDGIALTPSCGEQDFTAQCTRFDPGVFKVDDEAFGASGSSCAGTRFSVALVDARTGKVRFTPTAGHVTLPHPGSVCRIDLTIDVLKVPTIDARPAGGVQTVQIPETLGISDRANAAFARGTSSGVTVKASPTISTQASGDVSSGGQIFDSATLAGAVSPTGSITFKVYGPDDADCTGAVAFTSSVAVGSDGTATSEAFTPRASGTYRWIARYGGDASNDAVSGQCNDAGEQVTVSKRSPTIATNASASVTVGGQVHDVATLDGEYAPTSGTVTFRLYGPDDALCAGTEVFTSTVRIRSNGTATSQSHGPTAPGTYRWIARYNGDANNHAVSGQCNDPDEQVTVTPRSTKPPTTTPPETEPPETEPPAIEPPVTEPPVTKPPAIEPPATPARPAAAAAVGSSTPVVPTRGEAKIKGAAGCVGKRFPVRVSGSRIRRVVFTLDGRRISTQTKPTKGSYGVTINPNVLARGVHRVVAKVTYLPQSKTKTQTLRVVFSRCKVARGRPRFTG